METKGKRERTLTLIYLMIYLVTVLTIALHQPLNDTFPSLCNAPDEHSRYKVPLYICEHGTLPTGFEEELFSGECRWTYGFYTLLPYMVQGGVMRIVNLFTDSDLALLYAARMVNVVTGLILAWLVILIGKKLFKDDRIRWMFCFLVTFLPQSLFLHTYVNPDSMCLLSTALMIYGILSGYEDAFSFKSCSILTLGVILCALSYYNAYGFILSSILLFTAFFLKKKEGKWQFELKPFLKKGLLISVVVLLCIGWHFVRNYILYDGDMIGLTTKENFVKSFGIARETFKSQGSSLLSMFVSTTFLPKLVVSFIANYGNATIYTWPVIYVGYIALFVTGILGAVCIRAKEKTHNIFFHVNMVFCMVMPLILTIHYAYAVDYQAQGRYIMPGLLPFAFYVCRGLEKLPFYEKGSEKQKQILTTGVMVFMVLALLINVFVTALPYYLAVSVL